MSPLKCLTGSISLAVVMALASCHGKRDVVVSGAESTLATEGAGATGAIENSIRESLVTITIRGSEVKPHPMSGDVAGLRNRIGVVLADGKVLTTLGAVDGAEWVEITDARGEKSQARGVASYLSNANIALLDVAWSGSPPPAAALAEVSPPREAEVQCFSGDGKRLKSLQLIECRTPNTMFAKWPGMPSTVASRMVMTYEGKILSLTTGFFSGVPMIETATKCGDLRNVVDFARPEVIRVMKPEETIPWNKWREKLAAIKRSDQIARHAYPNDDESKDSKMRRAATEVSLATRLDPRNAWAWSVSAYYHLQLGQLEEGEAAARQAVALAPTDDRSNYYLAGISARTGEYEDALKAIDAAIAESDREAGYYHMKAYIFGCLDRTEEAMGAINLALMLDPDNEEIKAALARMEKRREHEATAKTSPDVSPVKLRF